jgi:hypothetical protein
MSATKSISLGSGVTGKFTIQQDIGTTTEALTVPADFDVSYCAIKNLDATNFVLIDFVSPAAKIKLKPGESCCFRPADSSAPVIYALADTAECPIQTVFTGTD